MREPHNLIAFLEQIRYNEYVERSYLELLRKREQIVEHLRFSMRFGEDLAEQAKCAMDFYLLEKGMSYLKITPDQFKRINLPEHRDLQQAAAALQKQQQQQSMIVPWNRSVAITMNWVWVQPRMIIWIAFSQRCWNQHM